MHAGLDLHDNYLPVTVLHEKGQVIRKLSNNNDHPKYTNSWDINNNNWQFKQNKVIYVTDFKLIRWGR